MSSRGPNLDRVVQFFKTADIDVAQIALKHCDQLVQRRLAGITDSADRQAAAASTPRKQRKPRARKLTEAVDSVESETLANA